MLKTMRLTKNTAGYLIKAKRERDNLTLEDVAETLGIGKATISSWENGKNKPTPKNLGVIKVWLDEDERIIERNEEVKRTNIINHLIELFELTEDAEFVKMIKKYS